MWTEWTIHEPNPVGFKADISLPKRQRRAIAFLSVIRD
jgi:hypothetical protein